MRAYGLMRNHFHLVLETPRASLVAGLKWWPGVYTKRLRWRRKGDLGKVAVARRLRQETTMILQGIADSLHKGRRRMQPLQGRNNIGRGYPG